MTDWSDEVWVLQQKCLGASRWYSSIAAKVIIADMFSDYKKFVKATHMYALLDACLKSEAFRLDPTGYESEEDLTGLDD